MRRENDYPDESQRNQICFNPLPPQCGGRIAPRFRKPRGGDVSIRSRRNAAGECWRLVRRQGRAEVSIRSRRNAAGEWLGGNDGCPTEEVSIRSRRNAAGECRSSRQLTQDRHVSIRSRRNAAGESVDFPLGGINREMFQSAPAAMRRENQGVATLTATVAGFNPLPPQCGGRIQPLRSHCCCSGVSIRSRRNAAGELPAAFAQDGMEGFQSAPAAMRRENVRFDDG